MEMRKSNIYLSACVLGPIRTALGSDQAGSEFWLLHSLATWTWASPSELPNSWNGDIFLISMLWAVSRNPCLPPMPAMRLAHGKAQWVWCCSNDYRPPTPHLLPHRVLCSLPTSMPFLRRFYFQDLKNVYISLLNGNGGRELAGQYLSFTSLKGLVY